MASPLKNIVIVLVLICAYAQLAPTTGCPLLCVTSCSTGRNCSSCYVDFQANSSVSQTCACPKYMYLDSANYCKPCPIYCSACTGYTYCTSCVTGYMLQNNYSCILNTTNENGWVSKNVTYQLAGPDYTGFSNLIVNFGNGTSINITNTPLSIGNLLSNCSKFTSYNWLGGYRLFNYKTKVIKTVFNLPPHQWLNVMFQAILIDKWLNNTLLLQLNTQQNYNPNSLQSPSVIWSGTFNSGLRTYDLCGDSTVGDNLAIVNTWISHNASSLKLQARLNQSDLINASDSLNSLWFGIRQLYIRVGTCGRNCQYCSSPTTCTRCMAPYVAVNGICLCDSTSLIGFPTLTGCSLACPAGQYYNATANDCLDCGDQYDNCSTCSMTQCLTCKPGYLYFKDASGNVNCVRFCPNNFTQYRGYTTTQNQTINNTVTSVSIVRDSCVACPLNCLTCNRNLCLFCYFTYQYYQGTCVGSCPSGTYSSYGSCIACPVNCTACSSDGCVNCTSGFTLQNNQCYRSCVNSSIIITASTISCNFNCSSPCLTCFGPDSNQCLTCLSGMLSLYDGTCRSSCPQNYFAENNACINCPYGCLSCSDQNTCNSCISGYYLSSSLCVRLCPKATYPYSLIYDSSNNTNSTTANITGNNSQNSCLPCPNGCQRCSDSNTCLECAYNFNFFNFTCRQEDPDDYQPWEGRYRKCSPNCLKCRNKICTRCQSDYFLNQGYCVSECPPQKYPRSLIKFDRQNPYQENVCVWKNPLCYTYNNTLQDGSCSQCSFTFPALTLIQGWQRQPDFLCTFTCPEFYTKTDNLTCLKCPQKCLRCFSNMTCTQCIDGYSINTPNLLNSSNVMTQTCLLNTCPLNYFSDSQQCQSCPSGCGICLLDNTCYDLCPNNSILDPNTRLCLAQNCTQPNQYFDVSSNLCKNCSTNCRTCSNQSTACTSCPIANSSSIQTYLYNGSCSTTCPLGYFIHKYSQTCRLCNPRCSSCTNFDNCLTCKSNFYILNFYSPQNALCVAQCPTGFWTNTTICQRCFPDCKACYGPSEYQCLSCYPNFYLDDYKCVYSCSPMKYKDNQGHCDWCHPSCQQCTGPGEQDCIGCPSGQFYYDHRCFNQSCPGSTYLSIPNLRICEPCQFGCTFCSSSQFCYFCTPGYKFYQGWCYGQCPGYLTSILANYYLHYWGDICRSCKYSFSKNCLSCDRTCKRCNYGYYLYRLGSNLVQQTAGQSLVIEQCYTSCPQGTYPRNDGGRQCVSCQANCLNCTSFSSCIQCGTGFNLINGYCTSNCPAYTYQSSLGVCANCPQTCLSCTSPTICTACISNYYLYESQTLKMFSCFSTCPTTFYADLSGWCVRCPSACVTCSSAAICTSCQTGYTLISGVCSNSSNNTCNTGCISCSGGNCRACNSSFLLYTNTTSGANTCAPSCNSNWFAFAGKCNLCNVTCATCTNNLNNCSSCVAGLYLYQQSCLPICPTSFFASITTRTCQPCPSNCTTCNNGSCTQCASGYFLSLGFCNKSCPAATFASQSTQICFNCTENCGACLDIQNCTACTAGYSLFRSSCVNNCPSTTYKVNNANGQVCLPCVSPCFTCTAPNSCLSCIGSYILNGTICQQSCGAGYYLRSFSIAYEDQVSNQDYSNFLNCLRCNVECLTCRDYASRCISCAVGYVYANGQCKAFCPDGTYNASSFCKPCSSYCVTCSDLNTCAVCVQGTVLYKGFCISNCPEGNYMILNSTAAVSYYYCAGCSTSCQACNGSTQYNCLSCISGLFLSNGMCLRACPQGLYASNLTRTCSPCPITCTNCTSFSTCGACITNYTLSNTNQCNAPSYIVCNVSYCVSCSASNQNQCQQCITNYYLLTNGTCSLTCPNSTYAQTGQCINCPTNCTTCSPSQCTSCQQSLYLFDGKCISTCPVSTLPSQNTCVPDPCLYYSNSYPNSCLACTAPYLLATTNASSGYQSCVSSCPAGTVQSSSQCLDCGMNCTSCQSSTSCSNCSSGLYLNAGLCVYNCPVGTYASGSQCQSCNISFCLQCNGPNSCTQCSSQSNSFLYNGQCYLSCPAGTYSDYSTGLCADCSSSCQTCTSASYCTTCNSAYYYYQGSCLTACPLGTYNTSSGAISKLCSNCSSGCNNCFSAQNCTSCQPGYIYSSSQRGCVTSCSAYYYAALVMSSTYTNSTQYQCVACILPCITCTSSTKCVTCQTGTYYFNQGSCVTSCPSGYFVSSGSSSGASTCLPCDSSCLNCTSSARFCTACPAGFAIDSQGNCNSNCSSPSTYFVASTRQCLNCSSLCYSCQGPLSTDCLSCKPPSALFSGSCLNACPFGYYASSTYVCGQCNSPCASCAVSANNCTSCIAPNLLQPSTTGSTCSVACSAGFYPSLKSQYCQPCNSPCLGCSGPANNQCTSCHSGKILSAGSCIESCPSGTALIQQGAQWVCQACSAGCAICSISSYSTQASNCTRCKANYYIYSGSCHTSCPDGTYSSPTSFSCTSCGITGCQRCRFNSSMLVQCTVCQAGYYALGNTGTCVTSCPSGSSLRNTQCVFIQICQQYTYNGLCIPTCPTSTYPVSSPIRTCLTCSSGCYSCLSANSCSQCSNTTFLYLNMSTNASSCVGYCATGQYGDASTRRCTSCSTNCSACYQSKSQVICTSCQSGVLLGTQCTPSCPAGYYSTSSNVCKICSCICLTCTGASNNCSKCKNINYTAPACSNPSCSSTQYLTASGSCSNCNSACSTCYGGNSYECITCSSTAFLFNGQCFTTCPQGTTPDSSRTCISCTSNCATCNSTTCNQCNAGYFLVSGTGQCVSSCSSVSTNNQTYYANSTNCNACTLANCQTCVVSNSTVICQTCQSSAYSHNNSCISSCPAGNYPTNNPNRCIACASNCVACTSATVCSSCSPGYALISGSCSSSCNSGFYLSTSSSITTCSQCSSNCINCTSANSCASCAQPYTLVSGYCTGCLSGYYYSSTTNTCLICSSSCATCSLTSTNCTVCASGYSLLNSSVCVPSCPVGYYSSSSVCTACSTANCAVCPSNSCTSCSSSYVQYYDSGVLTCRSSCPNTTFLNSASNLCVTCSNQCLTCSSATTCTQCSATYILYLGYCISSCPSGYVAVNSTCSACPANCKNCTSLTSCTACVSGAYSITNGLCTINRTCTQGYANSLNGCSQCYPSCKTCNGGGASNCLTCQNGSTLSNGVCIQNCDAGTFYDSTSVSCKPCSTLFSNCASCTSTACYSCSTNYTIVDGSCALTCPSGTYQSSQQCNPCPAFCAVCNSSNSCTQCVTSTFLVAATCLTSCPLTYYQNGTNCSLCFQTCNTCTNSTKNSCTSCISPYNYYQNTCIVSCPDGTYASNYTCQTCPTNCLLCSSIGCTQCASRYFLINFTCRSTCPTGYYVDSSSGRCLACVAPCTQCTSRTNCSACSSPYTINATNCVGPCPSGQYYNTSLVSCVNCQITNCSYCNSTSCMSCQSSYYSYYSSGVIQYCVQTCNNIQGTFNDNSTMNCSSCYSSCQTCANASYCYLCSSNYYLLSLSGVNVNQCLTTCPLGYYATSSRTCLPCSSNCNVCQNSTYCNVCASNYYMLSTQNGNTTSISCVSQCPTAYSNPNVINGSGSCILCPTSCLACADSTTCTQCDTSLYVLYAGKCVSQNCLNCQNCSTNNVCLNCTSPYYLNNGKCVTYCSNGYYGNITTGLCTKCMSNCLLCPNSTDCTQCSDSYTFVSNSSSCQNQGYVDFGAIGNMSGFTSNITEVMATVYVSTSVGPIAFGALSNTYGIMNVCQFMYFLQGSCGNNSQLSTFLNSLSMVSYTSNPNNQSSQSPQSASASRLLTGIDYTSSFLETNLPIFLMMIGFFSAYILVTIFAKYNESCCINFPTVRKYISYICQFMQKRFKYIYVDCVMWISYLPFLYFSMLQLQKLQFDTALNAISTILAFIIIIVYPLYPVFILKKLFDKSSDPNEHLKNYSAITLRLPLDMQEEGKRSMCEGVTCCPKQNPDVMIIQMSLSPWIDSVVRPVYNQDVPQYRQFRYFTIPHFRLAYAAIKYIRKFIFILVAAVCPDPLSTLGILVLLNVIYMLYLIILRPKQKIYLILELILQSLILFFLVFMFVYLKLGGATITSISVIAHGIGFLLANSSLAIAIILNIMSYYTIICCVIDLVRVMKGKVEADDIKEKQQQFNQDPANFNEKNELPMDGYYGDDPEGAAHMDLEKDLIKKIQAEDKELGFKDRKKKGDDQMTEENNDEDYPVDQFNLDEKEFAVRSSMMNKKKSQVMHEGDEIPNLKISQGQHRKNRRDNRRQSRQIKQPKYEDHTEDQIMMGRSKLSSQDSSVDVNQGLIKQRENDKYKRKIGNNELNVEKGIIKEATDRFKRNPKHKNTDSIKPQQQSMDLLFTTTNVKQGNQKYEQVQDINTHDRIKKASQEKTIPDGEALSRKIKPKQQKNKELQEIAMKQRQLLERQKQKKMQEQLQNLKMRQRQRNKKAASDPFGEFQEILQPKKNRIEDLALKQKERKAKENVLTKQKHLPEFILQDEGVDLVQRKPQPKKPQNKFYKRSDEEGEVGQVQTKERQANKFKRNAKNNQKIQDQNIEGYGKDIYTKKADKKQSIREFAEDNAQELTYKERQGKGINKKSVSVQQKERQGLDQIRGIQIQKKIAQKQGKPSIYDKINEDIAESITFDNQVKVRQPKSLNDPAFQEQNMEKQRKRREEVLKRQKDNKLKIGSNQLQQSYDDVVNKNKQQIFKQDITKKSHLLDIEGDFQEQSYDVRPESKAERSRSRSRNKDLGLSANNKAEDSQDDSYDTRKQRNLASQRLRKKGNMQLKQEAHIEEDNGSRDSRRISKIKGNQKLKVKSGVLNIDDNSQNQDIQQYKF